MLEAYSAANSVQKGLYLINIGYCFYLLNFNILGKRRELDPDAESHTTTVEHDLESHALKQLKNIVESPPDSHEEYTRIKKDIFHAFHMLPIPVNHGSRPAFLRALRDHLMRWDPVARSEVDKVCRKHFDVTTSNNYDSYHQSFVQQLVFKSKRSSSSRVRLSEIKFVRSSSSYC